MAEHVYMRLRSERGASLSFAILAFLVCAGVAAVILAAATASMGQFAELGKMDQRYYAVTSAANLFRDSLGADDEVELTFVQVREGTGYERVSANNDGDDDDSGDVEDVTMDEDYTLQDPLPEGEGGFDFLPAITSYALFGPEGKNAAPFSGTDWDLTVLAKGYVPFAFEVAPTLEGSEANPAELKVEVEARLRDDWTLELVFRNDGDEDDCFYLYMLLEGMLEERTETSETLGDTTVDPATGVVRNEVAIAETRTCTVTWQLQQIVPGRGFAHD